MIPRTIGNLLNSIMINNDLTSNSQFLKAFTGENTTIPVWFMRQAGRYLPEYQAIRRKHHLNQMFRDPSIAAEVTCQPIDILNVDAAILFADILSLPALMGHDVHFDPYKGPILEDFTGTKNLNNITDIQYVAETIKRVNKYLNNKVPLIGFAGSPFTVLTYLIEGGSTTSFRKTFQFMIKTPSEYHKLMTLLTDNTITYLNLQKEAGIDVFQLFDSWIGVVNEETYNNFVLPYIEKIFNNVDLPSIYFVKHASQLIETIQNIDYDFLSVCEHVKLTDSRLCQSHKGVQGNLFNGYLYADDKTLMNETINVLNAATHHKKYIFNLGHGIFPDIDPNKLKLIVETVHNFKKQ